MDKLPTLVQTPAPANMPDPFGSLEEFAAKVAALQPEDGFRPQHMLNAGAGDTMKQHQALVSGMVFLRTAADLEIAESKTVLIDNQQIVVYAGKDAAREFWAESAKEGKSPKEIYEAWAALRELMATVRGKDSED